MYTQFLIEEDRNNFAFIQYKLNASEHTHAAHFQESKNCIQFINKH